VFSNNVSGNRGGAIHNSGTVSISSSRFENNSSANQGGAIYNDGTLTILLSNFSTNSTGNNGGAICQFSGSSVLTITNSTFSGNLSNDGGAIRSDGTLTLSNSTLTSNVASNNGGGLFNLGTAKITNSTFYGNTANSLGGGIRTGGIVEISSSTFSANSAGSGGAIENFDYTPTVSTSLKIANTILANSVNGGDYAGTGAVGLLGSATAANNLVSQGSFAWATTKTSQEINLGPLQNNGGPTFTMAVVDGSATVSAGNSSISNAPPVNGLDQRGTKRSSTTPTIGAYEFVPVYPSVTLNNRILAPNSNTISIIGTGFSTTANKNTVTFSNGAVGTVTAATATELTVTLTTQPTSTGALTAIVYTSGISYTVNSGNPVQVATVPTVITVTTLTDTVNPSDNLISLREAITSANGTSGAEYVLFDSTLFTGGPGTITLAGSALPTIGNAASSGLLTIGGPGASTLTISGDNGNTSRNFNIFNIGSGADFTVSGVTVTGAKTTGNGGAFSSNSGILTVTDAVITNNTANSGAGIYGNSGTLTVSNTSITGNTSTGNGGGIFNFGRYGNSGPVKITNTTISGNNAVHGGGISNTAPSITITDSSITGNTASGNGGGISNDGRYGNAGPMTITNTTISGNNATGIGGGINTVGVVTITGSTIANNKASGSGGGIRNDSRYGVSSPAFSIDTSSILNNTSNDSGGGIFNSGPLSINNSSISGNTTTNSGGGINNDSRYGNSGTFIVTNTTISANTASNGGGVRNGGPIDFSNTTISGNSASSNGGGVFNDSRYGNGGIQTLTNVTIAGNSANNSGGAFYNVGGTVKIYNSILGNSTKGVEFGGAQPSNASNNIITSGTMTGFTTVTSGQLNLGPLQNNGGNTSTMALGAGSAAIGAANTTISNAAPVNGLDQRGVSRSATTPSIGAFEYAPPVASKLGLTTNAAVVVNGLAFGTQPVITFQDSFGATASNNNSSVTMTVSNGATTLGTTTVNAINGVATFTDAGISGTVGTSYTLTFSSNGLVSATQNVTVVLAPNTPTFATPVATADGFTVQISNYDASFTYGGTATAGSVSIDGNGLVTVTGVSPNTSFTATITTNRTNYASGSAQVTATALNTANNPTFGTPTPTANGFSVQINNYDANFTYSATATAGSVSIDGSGLVTVTGLSSNTSSTATMTTARTNYVSGSTQVTATSLNAANTPTFGAPTPTAGGFTVQISNYDASFTYGGTATAGSVSVDSNGLVTVTGVSPNTSSTATITTNRTNYASGSAQVTATALNGANTPSFGISTATADGFTVQISNYDANFTYSATSTAGSVSIDGNGLVTVTGLSSNTSSTATMTTARTNYVSGS
ncbi:MAG: beta strand repeat-containing protein, partial [Planctomycetia bacterium]